MQELEVNGDIDILRSFCNQVGEVGAKVSEQRDPRRAMIRSIKRPDFSVRQLFCVLCDHLDKQTKDRAELARQERLDFVVTERRHAPDSLADDDTMTAKDRPNEPLDLL
jgi:hypothetical protein